MGSNPIRATDRVVWKHMATAIRPAIWDVRAAEHNPQSDATTEDPDRHP